METTDHSLSHLFKQLGLPHEPQEVAERLQAALA
jgi:hypothetical protein